MSSAPISSNRMVILFVDHDRVSLDEIVDRISSEVATSTMKPVGETHDLSRLLLDPEPTETLAERTIAKIAEQEQRPDLVLVDLSFDNKNRDGSVQVGRRLAQAINAHFLDIAVGVYSKFELSPRDKGLISADKFALRLDEYRKMYENLAHQVMTGDDWNAVFDRVRRKSEEEAARLPLVFTTQAEKNIIWMENHPLSRSFGFERAASHLVSRALSSLALPPNSQLKITQLTGGFSGAFLIKAEIAGGASFVVKIDEDPDKLVKELNGYRKVRAKLNHKYYLTPISSDPVKLTPDWWGAFAVPYEVDAKPLLEELPPGGSELAALYKDLWDNCLFNLYGVTTIKKTLINDIVPKGSGAAAVDAWNALSRYADRFSSFGKARIEAVQGLLSMLVEKDTQGFHSCKINVPWVEEAHGDLNCRNILYHDKNQIFRILDFPNLGPNCLAFDFVKAEAELMLIILDWTTGRDCDFERIKLWETISRELSQSLIPKTRKFNEPDADRAFQGISAIRQLYKDRAADNGDVRAIILDLFVLQGITLFVICGLNHSKTSLCLCVGIPVVGSLGGYLR